MSKTSAVLLMGGSGERFQSSLPKQFHMLSGKKVYLHTLERIYRSGLFHEIIVVAPLDWADTVSKDVSSYEHTRVIIGGKTRQESSYVGIQACKEGTEYVLIHDAVRPFVSLQILQDNVTRVHTFDAVDTCIPSADTLVYAPEKDLIESIPNRSHYLRGQTPQTFSYELIKKAHKQAIEDGIGNASDDCQLVIRIGEKVHVVLGEEKNLKITTELDLFLAEQYFRLNQEMLSPREDFSTLKGKVVVITGGSGGIGQEIEKLLKEAEAIPVSVSRSSEDYPADLTKLEEVRNVFRKIHEKYGHIDGLINSVGYLCVKGFDLFTPEEIDKTINVNLLALIYSCRHAKIRPRGHIINIASSSYSKGRKDLSVYASTKAAVVNFTQGLAEERLELNINVVVPQRTATLMRYQNFPEESPKELLSPQKVAAAVLEILTKEEMTGCIVEVRKSF